MTDVTRILSQLENGDSSSSDELLPLVYDELRKLATARLSQEQPGQTLQATALVHEAYMRLVDVEQAQHWDSRGHFFAAAAEAMRRILVESARRRGSLKRGAELKQVDLEKAELPYSSGLDNVLAVDEALTKLAEDDAKCAELVKLRYFAGLPLYEAGKAMGISRATAFRYWAYAKAFLACEMEDDLE